MKRPQGFDRSAARQTAPAPSAPETAAPARPEPARPAAPVGTITEPIPIVRASEPIPAQQARPARSTPDPLPPAERVPSNREISKALRAARAERRRVERGEVRRFTKRSRRRRMAWLGAAGVAVTKLLQRAGIRDVVVTDSRGIVHPARTDLTDVKTSLAATTNPRGVSGSLAEALDGADVFVGVSGGQVPESEVALMSADAMVFALANPTPEVHPDVARRHARIVATGRSDFPNQINNVLAFPGIFKGALASGASAITEEMKLAAARAIADLVPEPSAEEIVPSVFLPGVADAVAAAVARLA